MKKELITVMLILMCLSFWPSKILAAGEKERVIIGFKEAIEYSVLEDIPYTLHHQFDSIKAIAVTVPTNEVNHIKVHKEVAWVEKDTQLKTEGQIIDWGYEKTFDIFSKELNITGKGVKIGVIDTGIQTNHPDLNVAGGINYVKGSTSYNDDHGHGTHVAGIIAAQNNDIGVLGIAPDAEMYAIKALDASGEGKLTDIVAGIEWAIEKHLNIVNLSLTSSHPSIALQKVTEKASESGLIIVAAAGNDYDAIGEYEDILYPARYPSVVGVGALNKELKRAWFSYYGPSLDFTAPGEEIFSTFPSDKGKEYTVMSGSSMAAAYVTGVISLYKEAFPQLSNKQLLSKVESESVDLGESGWDPQYGYGVIHSPMTRFSDVNPKEWYFNSIHDLSRQGYVKGFEDGTLHPKEWITRGEVITLIGRILELNSSKRETTYKDVLPNYYASGYIASATEKGIITGSLEKKFYPTAKITRGDTAVIIQRAFQIPLGHSHSFNDVEQKKYYAPAINALANEQIITGYNNQTYYPEKLITRAEFFHIVANALKLQ